MTVSGRRLEPADRDDVAACEDAAVRILSGAAQTEVSLRRRLEGRGFSGSAARTVASSMARRGFIDDDAFARALTEKRVHRGHGRALVAAQLRARGVGERPIADALEGVTREDEMAAALRVAQALVERTSHRRTADPERRLTSIVGAMRRRGFDMESIRVALRQVDLSVPLDENG
jgi:regulatory protein